MMMTQPTNIGQEEEIWKELKLEGWSLSKEICSSLCIHSTKDKPLREALLDMDLRSIGQGIIKSQRKQLEPPLVLQVLERRNISIPQQKAVLQLGDDKSQFGRRNAGNFQQWIDKVSDGETTLTAVEDEVLVELQQNWKPGIKIVVVQPLAVFHGVFFVTRQDIKVLGGGFVQTSVAKERKQHGIQQTSALDGPPLFEPFKSSKRRSERLTFAGFDIDAFVYRGELRTINRMSGNTEPETPTSDKKHEEQQLCIEEKAKSAMLNFLRNLQGRKKPAKPVSHKPKVDATIVSKENEPQMSVERGIERLTNTLQEFTIKDEGQQKLKSSQQTEQTHQKEAEEIMRSFYSSREENSNHSRTPFRGRRGVRGRGRGRSNTKGRGRGRP